jgi:hypothetical protein
MVAIWLGQTALAAPRLVFNDTSFDYASHEVAYLHFARAAYSDLLTVYVNDQQEPDGLPLFLGKLAPELTREAIYQQLGVNVSEQALELSFSTQNMGSLELLSYFHSLAPKLGFSKEQGLFAGHTYVFSCGCEVHEDTHLRVSFNQVGDFIYVRLALQSPFAY